MYISKHYNISQQAEIADFIKANAFGMLISTVNDKPFATHIPFLIDVEQATISAHLAKENPQWQSINQQEVLIVLQGEHDYISPSWSTTAKVPTWNYQSVHIYGVCQTVTDSDLLQKTVNELTRQYESSFAKPWQPNYPTTMLKAIMGLHIEITDIQCQYKLSQNYDNNSRQSIAEHLQANGSAKLAQAMFKSIKND